MDRTLSSGMLTTESFGQAHRERMLRRLLGTVKNAGKTSSFLHALEEFEGITAKVLSLAMVLVILVAVADLIFFLGRELLSPPIGQFNVTIARIFGLFLNVLIALEILENITAYLKKHVIQVELVIVTSLIAVSRKIIILDLEKTAGLDLIGLAFAVLALSISYWIIRTVNHGRPNPPDR